MMYVFSHHPNAHTKRLNEVHEIFVQRSVKSRISAYRNNYCFHLLYKDGTCDDISFNKCFEKPQRYRKEEKRTDFMNVSKIHEKIPTKIENLQRAILNRSIPDCAGVYFIWQNTELIYIGESYNLRKRVVEDERHLYTEDPLKKYVNYIECDSKKDAKNLETALIKELAPSITTLKNNCMIAKAARRNMKELTNEF
jgi:predicted GIY-YIG superfamily endonuclease